MKIRLYFPIFVFLLIFPFFVNAQTIKFDVDSLEVKKNKNFSVFLEALNFNNVNGLVFDLDYNHELLDFVGMGEGNFFSKKGCPVSLSFIEKYKGKIIVSILPNSPCEGVTGGGQLITFNFRSKGVAGSDVISFSNNGLCSKTSIDCKDKNTDWKNLNIKISPELSSEDVKVLGLEYSEDLLATTLLSKNADMVNSITKSQAGEILSIDYDILWDEVSNDIFNNLIKEFKEELTKEETRTISYFIENGTAATALLGKGERAGVLASYYRAFGKVPVSENDWQDVIKIANGRWTKESNVASEEKAQNEFIKIYKRLPDFFDISDNSAINIFAYGLRPIQRDVEKEKEAINSFRSIYKRGPENAKDWDIIRGIAYSGASR